MDAVEFSESRTEEHPALHVCPLHSAGDDGSGPGLAQDRTGPDSDGPGLGFVFNPIGCIIKILRFVNKYTADHVLMEFISVVLIRGGAS